MRHFRPDYECIQPWPTKRAHIARGVVSGKVMHDVPETWADGIVTPIIGEEEPVFVLRAQDELMLPMLFAYLELLEENGAADKIKDCIRDGIVMTEDWQANHPTKVPDVGETRTA